MAGQVYSGDVVTSSTDNGLVAATEEVVLTSNPGTKLPYDTGTYLVIAWAQVTMGAAAGTVTPRIRRGTTVAGALVGEGNVEDFDLNDDRHLVALAADVRTDGGPAQYVLTLESSQTATFVNGGAAVLVIA